MYQLFGISNPGFSFTSVYLADMVALKTLVEKCKEEKGLTYQDFQKLSKNPSRVRMIVPFLRIINVIDNNNFKDTTQAIDWDTFFTPKARPFLKYLEIYSDAVSKNCGQKEKDILCDLLRELLSFYLEDLCNNRVYNVILNYMTRFETLDKIEFFIITSFDFNDVDNIMGFKDAASLIEYYRSNPRIKDNFEYSSNVNCYSYIMQILSDFNVCEKEKDLYRIKNKDFVIRIINGGGENV